MGGGYPGSHGCNDLIPHAKWHAQTSAALADMTRLVDFVVALEKKHAWDKKQSRALGVSDRYFVSCFTCFM